MPTRTRPPIIQDAIIAHLRKRILTGALAPGGKLPSRAEIQARFGTSTVTVQRAFDRLMKYGFVTTRGRNGTFVTDRPPHTSRYVMAFPTMPGAQTWVRYWTVLMEVAQQLEGTSGLAIPAYRGVDKHEADGDYPRLLEDVKEKRLAGIIFPTNPFLVAGTPVMDDPTLPRVAVMEAPAPKGVAAVDLDRMSFFEKALDYLAERNRRRVAILTIPHTETEFLKTFTTGLVKRGMTTEQYWAQAVSLEHPSCAAAVAHLMFHGPRNDRPDALVITDDDLVEHACAGLVAARCSVPADLDVVAYCNFPAPDQGALPVKRLGYDIAYLLKKSIELIDRRRASKKVPTVTMIPAVFESEIEEGVQ